MADGSRLLDEEVEGANKYSFFDLEDGVGIGSRIDQFLGILVVLFGDGEEEGFVAFLHPLTFLKEYIN